MSYYLRFTSHDLLRCRFAISATWETVGAVRALHDPRSRPYHQPWLEEVRERAEALDIAPLRALQPRRGWTPDFLTPGAAADIESSLALIRSTPPESVAAELTRTLGDQQGAEEKARIRLMLQDPAAARDQLADLIGECWATLLEPYWPRVGDLLAADIEYHSRLLAEGGLTRLIPELDHRLSWRDDTLIVATDFLDETEDLRGDGLLLIPGAFLWPQAVVRLQRPHLPAIMYPVRGIGRLWERPAEAPEPLARLIGRTRARLLADLGEPAATTVLAERHGLSPSTVSAHLTALRDARLVEARRQKHQVLYRRTELGTALL